MKNADVVVIGAGVIGSSIAYQLAKSGRTVILLDKGAPGCGASGSCDQAIFIQSKKPGLHIKLANDSRILFDTLESELETNLDFASNGGMVVIDDDEELHFMQRFVKDQRAAGIDIHLLDRSEARSIQPNLSTQIKGAAHSNLDAEISPLLLNGAYIDAARRYGAEILRHSEMQSVIRNKSGRVIGIKTPTDDIYAEKIVNAAGPYSSTVAQRAGIKTPVRPRRGIILISEPVPKFMHGIVLSARYVAAKHLTINSMNSPSYGVGLSLGQTTSGNLLIGGSREFVGLSRTNTTPVMAEIARHATHLIPALNQVKILRAMIGFRPATGDGLPIVEETVEGWITATGHEGDGIALSPITGILVLNLIEGAGRYFHYLQHLKSDRTSLASQRSEDIEAEQCG